MGAAARGLRLKAVGAGHSFNGVGLTDGVQVRLDRFTGVDRVDLDSGLVTIRAGTSLHDLNEALWQVGSGPDQSRRCRRADHCRRHLDRHTRHRRLLCWAGQPGARAAAGLCRRHIADVFARRRARRVRRSTSRFGALGVIGTVTLQCEPSYALAAAEAPMPLDGVLARPGRAGGHQRPLRVLLVSAYPTGLDQAQQPGPRRHATPAPGSGPAYLDDEMLVNAAFGWLNRLTTRRPSLIPRANSIAVNALSARDYIDRSYRVFTSRRGVHFRAMEYAVPATRRGICSVSSPRTSSAAESTSASPSRCASPQPTTSGSPRRPVGTRVHRRASVCRARLRGVLPRIRSGRIEVSGRPHWGTLHFLDGDALRRSYPRFDDFRAVRERLDPHRMFGNRYLDRVLG